MRGTLFMLAIAGCGFEIRGAAPGDPDAASDAIPDVAIDAPPPACPPDPALRLCFSFDGTALGPALANEGAAEVSAQTANLTRIERAGGGAAMFAADSSIWLPMHADVSGVLTIDMWFRADAAPGNDGGRIGLLDSNAGEPTNISLFIYRQAEGLALRCGLGTQLETLPAPIVLGTWHRATCTCEAGAMNLYFDGTLLGSRPGSCAAGGALVADGLAIGSDNVGNASTFPDRIAGAIDDVQLWSVVRAP